MKRGGILNPGLAGALASLGHTDLVVVCDAGLPIPGDVEKVDLAFKLGVPDFETVLAGVLEELIVESGRAASEVREGNPGCHRLLLEAVPDLTFVPHEELKRLTESARLVIRTGEDSPYSNVVLRCGVAF